MKEKLSRSVRKTLIWSVVIAAAVLVLMGVLLLWRYDFVMYDTVTFLSDVFTMGGLTYLLVFCIALLSRTSFFSRFGYLAEKRSARRHKSIPEHRTLQEYMEDRAQIGLDLRLLWIPGAVFFALAIILSAAAVMT